MGFSARNASSGAIASAILLQGQQQRAVGQLGVGLQLPLGVVDHRQQRRQRVFVAFQPFVADGQQVAVFEVRLLQSAGGNRADQGLQQRDGLAYSFRSTSDRASIRRTSLVNGLLGNRFSNCAASRSTAA